MENRMAFHLSLKRGREGHIEYEDADHCISTSEIIIRDELKASYEFKLAKTAGCSCTPMHMASVRDKKNKKIIIVTEPLGFTMLDHIKCSSTLANEWDGAGWWRKTDQGFRFDGWLQQILKKMILGITEINQKNVKFTFDMSTVFLNNDENNPSPKFSMCDPEQSKKPENRPPANKYSVLQQPETKKKAKSIQKEDKAKSDSLCQQMEKMLRDIEGYCGRLIRKFAIHPEVEEFREMLKTCNASDCSYMVGHPALLSDKEIFDFVVKFREGVRSKDIDTTYKTGPSFSDILGISKDWEDEVNKDPRMRESLSIWNSQTTHSDSPSELVRYARFISNFYHHTNKHKSIKQFRTIYDYARMEDVFFKKYPTVPSYLFKTSIFGEASLFRKVDVVEFDPKISG